MEREKDGETLGVNEKKELGETTKTDKTNEIQINKKGENEARGISRCNPELEVMFFRRNKLHRPEVQEWQSNYFIGPVLSPYVSAPTRTHRNALILTCP